MCALEALMDNGAAMSGDVGSLRYCLGDHSAIRAGDER